MDISEYFKSLTSEIESLKDRVRHYIGNAHWLSDGEWKESVLRTILRRHLPNNVGIGTGFIVTPESTSTQIDILLYDATMPMLFRDGDFIITTPDTVYGIIEVKTRLLKQNIGDTLNKLADNLQIVDNSAGKFYGLFSYETNLDENDVINGVLSTLKNVTKGSGGRIINCVSLGQSQFIRFWEFSPDRAIKGAYCKWHAYLLNSKASAYFIHNVIEHVCPKWTTLTDSVWYPIEGKEGNKIGEISLIES